MQESGIAWPLRLAGTIGMLLGAWWLLAMLHHRLDTAAATPSMVEWFPIPQFFGWAFHPKGFPYIIAFSGVFALCLRSTERLPAWAILPIGFLLIVLGNLGQGGLRPGFLAPFQASTVQYYHDALRIEGPWREWLARFNSIQAHIQVHGRTHPPFAILLHYWILKASGGSVTWLASIFTIVASTSVLLVYLILARLGLPRGSQTTLALLFAVVPAVNIYTGVSLDGVILTTSTLFLLGLVEAMTRPGWMLATTLCAAGFIVTNALTFGGVFLLGVGGLVSCRELLVMRRSKVPAVVTVSVVLFLLAGLYARDELHYNHWQSFETASTLENPEGFSALSDPFGYIQSRVEGISEFGFFLSFGALALLILRRRAAVPAPDARCDLDALAWSGMATFALLLLSGAFRVGETARACLYLYPYAILMISRANRGPLRQATILAACQTAAMQLFGNYFW